MKDRILKSVKILMAYILLNAGVISWIEVSKISESRVGALQTVMADIKAEPSDDMIEIDIFDRSYTFDLSVMDTIYIRTVCVALVEPAAIALFELAI